MAGNKPPPSRFSLQRWSQRKLEASREQASAALAPAPDPMALPPESPPGVDVPPSTLTVAAAPAAQPPAAELPAVETLTFESDFTAFLQPKVEEALKRRALKQLFRDPRFNVMDGLDVYIDDYSIPSPVSPELLREMVHARFTLDPPKTRVGASGFIEDVPPEAADAPLPAAPPTASAAAVTEALDAPGATGESAAAVDVPAPGDVSQPQPEAAPALPAQRIEPESSRTAVPAAPLQRNDDR